VLVTSAATNATVNPIHTGGICYSTRSLTVSLRIAFSTVPRTHDAPAAGSRARG